MLSPTANMADDIDIEEHDVLDNPAIKNIFPDISIIKKEISQYYENEPDIKQEPEASNQYEEASKVQLKLTSDTLNEDWTLNMHNKSPYPSKILENNSVINNKMVLTPQLTNKIILGSKPSNNGSTEGRKCGVNNNQTAGIVRLPKVILQDLGAYIYRNNRYCKDCFTLFPNRSDCQDHKRKFHSGTMNMRNKEIDVLETLEKPSLKHKCNICPSYFSTSANLSRHYKNIHKKKVSLKLINNRSTRKTTNESCVSSLVKTKRALSLKSVVSKNIKSNEKNVNKRERNKRIQTSILKKQPSKIKIQCNICSSYFSSSSNLSRHYKNIHRLKVSFQQKYKNASIDSNDFSRATKIPLPSRSKLAKNKNECFHCKKVFGDHKSLEDHLYELLEPKRYPKRQHIKNENVKNVTHQLEDSKSTQQNAHGSASVKDENQLPINYSKSNYTDEKNVNRLKRKHGSAENNKSHKSKRDPNPNLKVIEKEKENLTNIKKQKLSSKSLISKLIFESEDSDDNENIMSFDIKNSLKFNKYHHPQIENTVRNSHEIKNQRKQKRKLEKPDVDETGSKLSSRQRKATKKESYEFQPTKKKQKHDIQALDLNSSEQKPSINHKEIQSETETQYENNDNDQNRSQSTSVKRKVIKKVLCEPHLMTKTQKCDNDDLDVSLNSPKLVKDKQSQSDGSPIKETDISVYETADGSIKSSVVYECIYCSYMLPTAKAYFMHIVGKHKVENVRKVRKVAFEEQCKYCPSKSINERAHNKHLYAYHKDLICKIISDNVKRKEKEKNNKLKHPAFKRLYSFVLKSIIYKCNKCDIHFLSSCIAKDHAKHMEQLVHWKCFLCKRIFKKIDKYLHLKQHKLSKTINVCQFNETELSTLLYNCTKCAIHFTENRYLEHYPKCDTATTDSVYCKNCDILIDKDGYNSHDTYHSQGKNIDDFKVVVADIIEETDMANNKVEDIKKRNRRYEQANCLTFCQTCNSFLSDIALTRKSHIEAQCSEILKNTCNLCGLVLTYKALATHRDHHKKDSDLKLQDFRFFDLKGVQIIPPIPDYPQCNNCEVHFVGRNAVKSHICTEIEYMTCNICKIKLSENAFKLHMNFHNYSMLNANKEATKVISLKAQEKEATDLKTNIDYEQTSTRKDHSSESNKTNLVYSCYSCKFAVDEFDKVIEHCQNHYCAETKTYSLLKTCSKCSVRFESNDYEKHVQLHLRRAVITTLTFDPMYFTSDNNTWIRHIFSSVSPSIQKEVVGDSIYQHECRVKMKVVQKGPTHLTVYKCDKCGNFIDPDFLFEHIKDICPKNIRKHPCSVCGLPFMSTIFRSKHEKIHKHFDNVRIKTYNIVLINSETDNTYTANILNAIKQYVLYQCRKCEGVVDKWQRYDHKCKVEFLLKCSKCKLLVDKEEFERHICKHNDLAEFKTRNIKVVLFGNNNESQLNKILSPSFEGTVNDYTLYKCAQCEACVHKEVSISRHICKINVSKWKCPKCGFFICESLSLNKHLKMHDLHSEFSSENIKVIIFNEIDLHQTRDISNSVNGDNKKAQDCDQNCNEDCVISTTEQNSNADDREQIDDTHVEVVEEKAVPIYKCACGLHYMNEANGKEHVKKCIPKMKIIKQSCSKCSLLFNPTELFSHLVAHHGDKNKTYIYEVIALFPENTLEGDDIRLFDKRL